MVKRLQLLALLLITALLCAVSLSAVKAKDDSSLLFAEQMSLSFLPAAQDKPVKPEQTAEQVYKNIQVLKGMPASQLDAVMAFFTGSLGVRCNHCHIPGQFEKDEKPTKQTARRMIQMVFDLNKGSLSGIGSGGGVSCFTCHRGQTRPESVPSLGLNLWQPKGSAATAKTEAPLPSVDEILDRYVRAVGGAQAIQKITSRVLKGSRVGADGVLVPEEVYAKAPNRMLIVTSYPKISFRVGYNGTKGWARSSQGEGRDLNDEMQAQLKREALFYKETRLKEVYSKMAVLGRTTIAERETFIIEATPAGGSVPEKLFFDAQTGLLVRTYTEAKTVVGQYPTQIDYEDYREVDGVKLPFTIRWSIPGRVWGRKITEVKQNIPLDDAQFEIPATGK
jgi:photosynthetic reaction center cytochrome c subunit